MSAPRPGLPQPLLEVLGARWNMGAPVVGAAWLAGDRVAFGLADGTVAVARAAWDGAARVQPRAGGGAELVPASEAPPPTVRVGVHVGPCLDIAAAGARAVSGGADGRLALIEPDGSVATLADFGGPAIGRVAGSLVAQAAAVGLQVHRFGAGAGVLDLPAEATALAFDPAGRQLAIGHQDAVVLWSPDGSRTLARRGVHRALAWSPDGRTLMTGQDDGAHAWRLGDGAEIALGATGAPPLSIGFSTAGDCFVASGGGRVVCWQLHGADATRSECGVGSTAAVTRVACHPSRRLIAAGYAHGAVLLSQPDSADLLFIRAAGGGPIAALAWSPDGAFLAVGTEAGEIGTLAFPEALLRAPAEPAARVAA